MSIILGYFGQKSGRGWYEYDPSTPRVPKLSAETDKIILEHREMEVNFSELPYFIF